MRSVKLNYGTNGTTNWRMAIACAVIIGVAVVLLLTAQGADKYAKPGGSGNGDSWSTAGGTNLANSLSPGDTLWLAGGSYGNGFSVTVSGNAAVPVTIRKATSERHGTENGWNAQLDTQAVFDSGITLGGRYVTLDGNEWVPPGLPTKYGIKITTANGHKGVDMQIGNTTLRNVEISGPGYNQCSVETDLVHFGSGSLVSGSSLHDSDVGGFAWVGTSGSTIEYSYIYNLGAAAGGPHPDITYSAGGWTNGTFRWNVIANIVSEGCFFDNQQPGSNILFQGNLWFQGNSRGYGCVPIEFQNNASYGTVFLYGNTFVDWWKSNNLGGSTAKLGTGSLFKNNLFVNSNSEWPAGGMSYNGFFGVEARGANPVVGTTSPFVGPWVSGSGIPPATHVYPDSEAPTMPGYNPAQYVANFALADNSWAKGKGTTVPAGMNVDMFGNTGNSLGAFQGSGGSGPTPTPAPTATPTPPPVENKFAAGDGVTPTAVLNVRATPSGVVLGQHHPGDIGVVVSGPVHEPLKQDVAWYMIGWDTAPQEGYSGDDDLVKTALPQPTPTPTPSPTPPPQPTPTPSQTWEKWIEKQNTWIRQNPPTPDK